MIEKTYPRVCANCKWAELDHDEVTCHRYPPNAMDSVNGMILPCTHPTLVSDCWCGEFAAADNRPTRYDLKYPSYQEVDA